MSYRIETKSPALDWYAIHRGIESAEVAQYMLGDIADRYDADGDCEVLSREAREIVVREGGDTLRYRVTGHPDSDEYRGIAITYFEGKYPECQFDLGEHTAYGQFQREGDEVTHLLESAPDQQSFDAIAKALDAE